MLDTLLTALSDSAMAAALRQSDVAYPLTSAAHIVGLGLLIGSVVALDLRLLGVIRRVSLADFAPLLSRLAAVGVLLAVTTGVMLFSVQPNHYLNNSAFLLKLILIALALINVLVVHSLPQWRAIQRGAAASWPLKLSALTSLLLWLAVIVAGRWIAFL